MKISLHEDVALTDSKYRRHGYITAETRWDGAEDIHSYEGGVTYVGSDGGQPRKAYILPLCGSAKLNAAQLADLLVAAKA